MMTNQIQLTPQVVVTALHAEKELEEQESGTQTQTQILLVQLEEPMLIQPPTMLIPLQ